jgi:uncharacterized protein (TIGR03435 family)
MKFFVSLVIASTLYCTPFTFAQDRPAFDVVSVKENVSGPDLRYGLNFRQPDRITFTNAGIENVVRFAYDTGLSKIAGLPEWTKSARFDVSGKSERPTTLAEKHAMLRTLMEERFHLQLHVETSEADVYVLRLKAPGQLGPAFRQTTAECAAIADEVSRNGFSQRTCASPFPNIPGRFNYRLESADLQGFCKLLSTVLQAPVVDDTGLIGRYSILLFAQTTAAVPVSDDPDAPPSLFTALEEQAGLKLVRGRGPIQTFVIDHVERQSPD